ncbi:MAG: GNAT family N-acetyltransferase [Leptolyngbyaceae cyanobacterium RU_5_1]|nr:GNAT family N-acetyltransferase [Leptolyngbyaceae cyanobacterium RU_5_1]
MWLELASDEHHLAFAEWAQHNRLEEQTCRPIANGKRIPPSHEVITLVFLVAGIDEPVGRFRYFDINPRNRSAEFGYTINPQFRHQGMGTRMLNLAVTHVFSNTNLNKLYCQTAAFNTPSIKLLEKLSFHRDGVLREHHELDGKLWDDCIYSILRREWKITDR